MTQSSVLAGGTPHGCSMRYPVSHIIRKGQAMQAIAINMIPCLFRHGPFENLKVVFSQEDDIPR